MSQLDPYREANRANWDDRVPVHLASELYGTDAFASDPDAISKVVAFDAGRLGDVTGKTLLHLQCHFGKDTLSWARLGARVTGVDFSPKAIEAARALSERTGVPGRFLEAELYDTPRVLPERFDIVYTGTGAIGWLPDIRGWAEVVARLLAPGGTFYIREGHPVLWALDETRDDGLLVLRYPYFETAEPLRWDESGTYADPDATLEHTVIYDWNHGLGEIIQALLDAGLTLTAIEEHREIEWQALPWMVPAGGGRWRLPEGSERVPLMYSLTATAPARDTP